LAKDRVKIAFFGDNYLSDVYAATKNENWDGFPIIEEINFYDDSLCEGIDMKLLKYD
jgi:hypothetical protein